MAPVQLGVARRGKTGYSGGVLLGATIFQIGGYPGGSKGVIADEGFEPGGQGPLAHHGMGLACGRGAGLSCPVPRPILRNCGRWVC